MERVNISNEEVAKAIIDELEGKNAGLDTIKRFVRVAMFVGGIGGKDGTEICRMVAEGLSFNPIEDIY